MPISWIDLRERSPIDISRLVSHSQGFNSSVGIRISPSNLDSAKRSLIDARGKLDLMITSLQQLLYDRTILKTRTDEVLYGWLIDNIGRYMKTLDDKEEELLIRFDEVNNPIKRVGVSRLSAYAKILRLASESLIYESLLKSIKEYENIDEGGTEEGGSIIRKEPRTFLYILFQVLQVTLSLLGGIAREGKPIGSKKGSVGSFPTTWQSLIAPTGQKKISEKLESETGEKIEIDESMIENSGDQEKVETEEDSDYQEEQEEESGK